MKKLQILILLLVVGLHLLFLFNLQFTAWPEMFSYAYLKNNGFLLYKDMIHPYPPLLTLGLSFLYRIFGYKVEVLKISTWVLIIFNDFMIFSLIKKLTKKINLAIFTVFLYACVQPFLDGNMLWFDLAIVPTILLALYFFFSERNNKSLFLSGLFFGIAIFTKQTLGIFSIASTIILIFEKANYKKLLIFISGSLIIFFVFAIKLFQENSLLEFFNSTLINPFLHWSSFPGYVQFNLQRHDYLVLGILVAPFLLALYDNKILRDKIVFKLSLFLLLSAILVYPRFSFFHLQLFITLSVTLFSYQLASVKINYKILMPILILVFVFVSCPSFKNNWNKETRFYSNEDLKLADLVKEKTNTGERIFLLGLDSNIYTLANILPPKPWTDNFGWYLEIPGVQEEFVNKWETNPPSKIFWREPGLGNWFDLGVYQPKIIANWISSNYIKTTKIDNNIWMWERRK